MKKVFLFILLLFVVFITSCSSNETLIGNYAGTSSIGLPITMAFTKSSVFTNISGIPIAGTYETDGLYVTISISAYGQSQKITAKISDGALIFDDIILYKENYQNNPKTDNNNPTSNGDITFQDAQFEKAVRAYLKLSERASITKKICDEVTILELAGTNSGDISLVDLQYFSNLTKLHIDTRRKNFYQGSPSALNLEGIENAKKLEDLMLISSDTRNLVKLTELPNLSSLMINCQERELDQKGLNLLLGLKSLSLIYCSNVEVDRIACLTNLEYLDLTRSYSSDYSELQSLANLKTLIMEGVSIEGAGLSNRRTPTFINSLKNLEFLDFSKTYFSFEEISVAELPKLKKLIVTDNRTDDILAQLNSSGALPYIEMLTMRNSNYSDNTLTLISKALSLEYLDCIGSNVDSISELFTLTNLKTLYMNIPNNEDSVHGLRNLISLEYLYIQDMYSYDFFQDLKELKGLSITHIKDGFTFDCLKNCKKLELIKLQNYGFNMALDLEGIKELTALKELRTYGFTIKSTMPLDGTDIEVKRVATGEDSAPTF